ncbi:hypothetical protein GE107_23095 [Cohnella sp. CFH 77786]|uniref:hypothetical protein n=1 Tax=Cohnella sp. CFH 77786 TaxID=2662265 RepID=UPI001C60F5D6|nr:hypothetical protein [Cohnella sp. CFH 77786]MBW5448932.1 hypothetical protein [Cohnella sp. CFH 77786]
MKKLIMWVISITALLICLIFVYLMNLRFPVNEVSPIEVIYKVEKSSDPIIKVGTYQEYDWYISKLNPASTHEQLTLKMKDKGWRYEDQEGAGLFFTKNDMTEIITCQTWTTRYYLCKVNTAVQM